MTRIGSILLGVCLLMTTGVAVAGPSHQVRLPIPTSAEGRIAATQVVVERGDHLWKISATRLGPGASNARISPYWREVIMVNKPHLRSGDPDLIYPGEVVELPAIGPP